MKEPTLVANFPNKPSRGSRVELEVPGHKYPLRIDIHPSTVMAENPVRDEITGYGVNWSALGSVAPEIAEGYANAILLAVMEARALTLKFKGKSLE